jgi:hypothetical protein
MKSTNSKQDANLSSLCIVSHVVAELAVAKIMNFLTYSQFCSKLQKSTYFVLFVYSNSN